ncbi:GMC oxidoreductase [Nocardioides sp. LS1]|uniref:GMC oxidoreductase n=1 Tax=Nocardioides sp. LS1 TaxID=1027620 RepID=UPI000F623F6C|nr:GMC oxidoreductase [Nocardioides sp. LS1]GCD89961.1 pyranose oxidase [Nocardioides sp. LS1]
MGRHFPDDVDVAIVGSGPTGAAYARILSELRPDLRVAMFEVGPAVTDPPGAHVKSIADEDARADAQHRSEGPSSPAADGRLRRAGTFLLADGFQQADEDGIPSVAMSSNVGGMGAHWTCACPRPGDSERITFIPDLDDLLAEAVRLLGVSTDAFDDAPFAHEVRRRLATVFDEGRPAERRVQPMPLAVSVGDDGTVTWSGSDVVFGHVTRNNPRFTLHAEALVRRVLVEDGRVTGLQLIDRTDGTVHEVNAREVVVAADALRTPQLLWASGIRPVALGRYLNDQSQIIHAVRLRDVESTTASRLDPRGRTTVVRQSGVSWVPYTDAEPFHGQVMQLDASPVPLAPGDVPEPGSIVGLGWFCAKELSAEDRVTFDATETDGYGMPAMRVHYLLSEADHAVLDRARDSIKRAAAALGDPLDPEPRTLPLGASLHYQGTVRMGAVDDATTVCDPVSRVWGVDGLRVAGNGVIPTSTACNPTLTSVALAVAGARNIAESLPAARPMQEEVSR